MRLSRVPGRVRQKLVRNSCILHCILHDFGQAVSGQTRVLAHCTCLDPLRDEQTIVHARQCRRNREVFFEQRGKAENIRLWHDFNRDPIGIAPRRDWQVISLFRPVETRAGRLQRTIVRVREFHALDVGVDAAIDAREIVRPAAVDFAQLCCKIVSAAAASSP
eukprot:SAG11_NODE_165_length_13834_cov_72.998544_9_plen_163_part_00